MLHTALPLTGPAWRQMSVLWCAAQPAHAVEVLRNVSAVHAELLGEFDQGQVTFGKVRRLDGPVVNLGIAV